MVYVSNIITAAIAFSFVAIILTVPSLPLSSLWFANHPA